MAKGKGGKKGGKTERIIIKDADLDDDERDEIEERARANEEQDGEKLSEFLEQFGGKEYKVRVEQYDATEKHWAYLDTYHVDGFDAFATCKSFGPGRYRLTFLNERGKYVQGGQPQIRIGGKLTAPGAAPVAAPQEQDPLKHPMVVMMLAQMEKSQTQATELLKAVLAKPEPQKSSSAEVLDMLAKLKAMNPEKKEDETMKEVSKMLLLKMIEKGLGDGDGGGGEGGILSDIKEALPLLKDLMPKPRAGTPAAIPTQVTPQALPSHVSLPHQPAPAAPAPEATAVHPIIADLKPYVAIFKAKAENNVDADRAAQYLIDELYDTVVPLVKKHVPIAALASEESIIESLVERAKDPAQIEEVFKFAPELAPHKEWVKGVIEKAIVGLTTDAEEPAHAS